MVHQIRFLIISVLVSTTLALFNCNGSKNSLSCTDGSDCWTGFYSSLNIKSNSLFFIDKNHGWAVGDEGQIVKTVDGGRTWERQNSGITWNLRSVFFIDEQNGWVSGVAQKILRTTDGGYSWSPQEIECDSATILGSIHFNNAGIGWLISNYGDIYCSLDSGNIWTRKHALKGRGYSYLFFPTKDVGFAMQFSGNVLERTIDGGNSWETYPIPTQWTGDVCFIDENNGWVTENWGPSSMIHDSVSVLYTSNGGKSWVHQATLRGLFLDNIIFTDHHNGWMSDAITIYHTTDGGKSWNSQFETEDMGFIKDIFFINEANGWALTSDGYIVQYSHH